MNVVEDISLAVCRDYIKKNLLQPSELQNHTSEKMQIKNMFERAIKYGESNSALLIGPRSSGKTVLVNTVLSELNEDENLRDLFVVVYLNGLIHTDDAVALKAIAHQMNLNNVCEGKVFGSFAENLSFFIECLKGGDREITKTTIFILDEFDLFCNRNKQTLLYNLFDVAQSAEAPLCVLGITCRLDVVELMEKRVMSRFSKRQIYLFPEKSDSPVQKCLQLLSIPFSTASFLKVDVSTVKAWNKEVQHLCKSTEVQSMIEHFHKLDITERRLRMLLVRVISRWPIIHNTTPVKDFFDVYHSFLQDGKVKILESLSVLELCLIVSMKQHFEIYDEEPFNFEMILRSYLKFINQNSLEYTRDRVVIMKAFENISDLELIVPVKSTKHMNLKEYELYKLALLPSQIKAGIQNYSNLPTEVSQWVQNIIQ